MSARQKQDMTARHDESLPAAFSFHKAGSGVGIWSLNLIEVHCVFTVAPRSASTSHPLKAHAAVIDPVKIAETYTATQLRMGRQSTWKDDGGLGQTHALHFGLAQGPCSHPCHIQ